MLVEKLISDFYFQKQGSRIEVLAVVCSLVLARLQQVRTVARAIKRDFALLAAALRANTPVNGWTETLFFPGFADGAAHVTIMAFRRRWGGTRRPRLQRRQTCLAGGVRRAEIAK